MRYQWKTENHIFVARKIERNPVFVWICGQRITFASLEEQL